MLTTSNSLGFVYFARKPTSSDIYLDHPFILKQSIHFLVYWAGAAGRQPHMGWLHCKLQSYFCLGCSAQPFYFIRLVCLTVHRPQMLFEEPLFCDRNNFLIFNLSLVSLLINAILILCLNYLAICISGGGHMAV